MLHYAKMSSSQIFSYSLLPILTTFENPTFLGITHRVLVNFYRSFGTTSQSYLQVSNPSFFTHFEGSRPYVLILRGIPEKSVRIKIYASYNKEDQFQRQHQGA